MLWWDVRLLKPHLTDFAAPALAAATFTVSARTVEAAISEARGELRDPSGWVAVKAELLEIKTEDGASEGGASEGGKADDSKGIFCLEHRKVMTNGICPKCPVR
jgi:hypothetical protein